VASASPCERATRQLPLAAAALVACLAGGCLPGPGDAGRLERTWGRHGLSEGRFHRPRAVAINERDELFIVDMTGRIQVFDVDGKLLRGWSTPESAQGKPCGLTFDPQAEELLVADTHYFRMLAYRPDGLLVGERTIGGRHGSEPGEFGFVTDVARDAAGNYYVAEYGDYDRIQKFDAQGRFVTLWGGHGSEPGRFQRPQSLEFDRRGRLWVTDACNHRLQAFDVSGPEPKLVAIWGEEGREPGRLKYPYGLALDARDNLYVAEFGNHRIQKFAPDGRSLGTYGRGGRRDGELNQPWALAFDSQGRLHVLDTYNHRVQRIRM
jgi:DNA-binding beta-propeller fold protein YncE